MLESQTLPLEGDQLVLHNIEYKGGVRSSFDQNVSQEHQLMEPSLDYNSEIVIPNSMCDDQDLVRALTTDATTMVFFVGASVVYVLFFFFVIFIGLLL